MSTLQPHQQRVVEERDQLAMRHASLQLFLRSATFAGLDEAERSRLVRQAVYMGSYLDVLQERIAAFPRT